MWSSHQQAYCLTAWIEESPVVNEIRTRVLEGEDRVLWRREGRAKKRAQSQKC